MAHSIAEDAAMLRQMIRSSRPHSGSEEAHDAWDEAIDRAYAILDSLVEQQESLRTALEVLLDHAERIQEHVPKSENWYAVRDCARIALAGVSTPASNPGADIVRAEREREAVEKARREAHYDTRHEAGASVPATKPNQDREPRDG